MVAIFFCVWYNISTMVKYDFDKFMFILLDILTKLCYNYDNTIGDDRGGINMTFLDAVFKKKVFPITVNINAKFPPEYRAGMEDALNSVLHRLKLGEVTGGGTLLAKNGEIENCDIDIEIYRKKADEDIEKAFDIIEKMIQPFGIAKGSTLNYTVADENTVRAVGELEGMAIYFNGTDLPKEVYEQCDINHAAEQISKCLDGMGKMFSHWRGPSETALYYYGKSFEQMKDAIQGFISEYPLCEKCRIVRIA